MYKIETCFKEDITPRTYKLVLHVDANWTESAWQCLSNTTM